MNSDLNTSGEFIYLKKNHFDKSFYLKYENNV
jgi:hypothetical protein